MKINTNLCTMVIKSFKIENFKSIQSLELDLNVNLSMLTGVNNSGKTTILEAVALWVECFNLLVQKAGKTVIGRYKKGDYILGTTNSRYVDFNDLHSVLIPNFEDLFYNRNIKNTIRLSAVVYKPNMGNLSIGFVIQNSTQSRYALRLDQADTFNYELFNRIFDTLPNAVSVYFSSPVANIVSTESFYTEPLINQYLSRKDSQLVMRNRIYRLYNTSSERFRLFEQQLAYILYGSTLSAKIRLYPKTHMNTHPNVVIVYLNENEVVEKDLALLGSGSLQAIEILLNVYHNVEEKRDLYLILLDEPDSHIHRDVQKRLFEVLNMVSKDNQIILTTHNEALIRSTPLNSIFHINQGAKKISCLSSVDLNKLNISHFKGLYPSPMNPIIKSINTTAVGLDFVCAIESDLIVFCEGDDDARLLNYLFYQHAQNWDKKIMFWVLGGISRMFDNFQAYKYFFSSIKNSKTLWEKSCVIFDQDILIDEHKNALLELLHSKMNIEACCLNVYTQEAVLLTNLDLLAQLLIAKYDIKLDEDMVKMKLQSELDKYLTNLHTNRRCQDTIYKFYVHSYLKKMNENFGAKIKINEVELVHKLDANLTTLPIEKLANKDDVATIINNTLTALCMDIRYSTEDFYSLIQLTDASRNFDMWKSLSNFISERIR